MTGHGWVCVDGNEAAARVAHRLSEAVANHPITPGATTGVHNGLDAAKALLAEANVAKMTSALLRHGPAHVRCVEDELAAMLAERADDSPAQLRGSRSRAALSDPAGFERANHVRTLKSWSSRTTVSSGQAGQWRTGALIPAGAGSSIGGGRWSRQAWSGWRSSVACPGGR